MIYFWITTFGGLGALSRFGIYALVSSTQFPWGTLVANALGSLLIGVMLVLRQRGGIIGGEIIHDAVMIGFLGAFTTFSAFSAQSL